MSLTCVCEGLEGEAAPVLQVMRRYIRTFFGCEECGRHFEEAAASSMDQVKTRQDQVLWLWNQHNRVNARLAGMSSDHKIRTVQSATRGRYLLFFFLLSPFSLILFILLFFFLSFSFTFFFFLLIPSLLSPHLPFFLFVFPLPPHFLFSLFVPSRPSPPIPPPLAPPPLQAP